MTDQSESAARASGGLGASLQGLAATMMAIFQTRLALLATEVEEEKQRLLAAMAWGAAAVLLGCFALAFLGVFIVVCLWDSNRLLALGLMSLAFMGGSALAFWRLRLYVRTSGGMLAATLAELDADRQALMPQSQRDVPPNAQGPHA
jgi:uncharacterized membrane protein YqjE